MLFFFFQNTFPLEEAVNSIVQAEEDIGPKEAQENLKESIQEQNIEPEKQKEESAKDKKIRNKPLKPVYRKILTIKDMNKKNLAQENSVSGDIQEKNAVNEKILENPTSEANDLSNDNTKDRNNEGGVIKEPRINLTTILRGIRSLYIKY